MHGCRWFEAWQITGVLTVRATVRAGEPRPVAHLRPSRRLPPGQGQGRPHTPGRPCAGGCRGIEEGGLRSRCSRCVVTPVVLRLKEGSPLILLGIFSPLKLTNCPLGCLAQTLASGRQERGRQLVQPPHRRSGQAAPDEVRDSSAFGVSTNDVRVDFWVCVWLSSVRVAPTFSAASAGDEAADLEAGRKRGPDKITSYGKQQPPSGAGHYDGGHSGDMFVQQYRYSWDYCLALSVPDGKVLPVAGQKVIAVSIGGGTYTLFLDPSHPRLAHASRSVVCFVSWAGWPALAATLGGGPADQVLAGGAWLHQCGREGAAGEAPCPAGSNRGACRHHQHEGRCMATPSVRRSGVDGAHSWPVGNCCLTDCLPAPRHPDAAGSDSPGGGG